MLGGASRAGGRYGRMGARYGGSSWGYDDDDLCDGPAMPPRREKDMLPMEKYAKYQREIVALLALSTTKPKKYRDNPMQEHADFVALKANPQKFADQHLRLVLGVDDPGAGSSGQKAIMPPPLLPMQQQQGWPGRNQFQPPMFQQHDPQQFQHPDPQQFQQPGPQQFQQPGPPQFQQPDPGMQPPPGVPQGFPPGMQFGAPSMRGSQRGGAPSVRSSQRGVAPSVAQGSRAGGSKAGGSKAGGSRAGSSRAAESVRS